MYITVNIIINRITFTGLFRKNYGATEILIHEARALCSVMAKRCNYGATEIPVPYFRTQEYNTYLVKVEG